MRYVRNFGNNRLLWLAGWAMAAALSWAGSVPAQQAPADAVENLRLALKTDVDLDDADDLKGRAIVLEKRAGALRSVSDLRRSLGLQEWRDEEIGLRLDDIEERVSKKEATPAETALREPLRDADPAVRRSIASRLEKELRAALKGADMSARLAALTSIGEMGTTLRGVGNEPLFSRTFTEDLVRLVKEGDSSMRRAAAAALSKINPKPTLAAPALATLLKADDMALRRAGAEALAEALRAVSQKVKSAATGGAKASRAEVVAMGQEVVPVAASALGDSDAVVRRHCLEAIQLAAGSFTGTDLLGSSVQGAEGVRAGEARKLGAKERAELLPLARVLREAAPAVARALSDPVAENRMLAAQILDDMSYGRFRLQRISGGERPAGEGVSMPSDPLSLVSGTAGDLTLEATEGEDIAPAPRKLDKPATETDDLTLEGLLLKGLRDALPALTKSLKDPDVRVRLASIDALETLQNEAAPAIPAMVDALGDCYLFMRWASARTLGKLPADQARSAIPGLTRLLGDEDFDVRLAATTALQHFGAEAAPATAPLAAALIHGDPDIRIAAARTLESIGSGAQSSIPALTAALGDENARVRKAVAEVLGKFGPTARSAVPALRRALKDTDPEVRQAASDALLDIMQAPKKEL